MNQRFCNGMIHVIKQGENLYQLSRKYRVPLALILRANPYVDVYNLQIGQEICIPVSRPYPGMMRPPQPQQPPQPPRPMPREDDGEDDREDDIEDIVEDILEDEMEKRRYVSDGTKSLGELLDEWGIDDLSQIRIPADVVFEVSKKV